MDTFECAFCKKETVKTVDLLETKFCNNSGDTPGIWFGDVQEWLFFDGQTFCDINCMLAYMFNWYSQQMKRLSKKYLK